MYRLDLNVEIATEQSIGSGVCTLHQLPVRPRRSGPPYTITHIPTLYQLPVRPRSSGPPYTITHIPYLTSAASQAS